MRKGFIESSSGEPPKPVNLPQIRQPGIIAPATPPCYAQAAGVGSFLVSPVLKETIVMVYRVLSLAAVLAVSNVMPVSAEDAGQQQCPISAAVAKLPRLTYVVAEETCACPKSAATKAENLGVPVVFVVGNATFDNKNDAQVALVNATEAYLEEFGKPCKCAVSGLTTVAGKSMQCEKTAAKLASLVNQAMDGVYLTYKVGDEQCHCPNQAASLAKQSGNTKLYVVGEECTDCKTTARLNLARAKFRAAVEALVAAEQKAEANSES